LLRVQAFLLVDHHPPRTETNRLRVSIVHQSCQRQHCRLYSSGSWYSPAFFAPLLTYSARLSSPSPRGCQTFLRGRSPLYATIGPAPSGENAKRRQLEYDSSGRFTSVCAWLWHVWPEEASCCELIWPRRRFGFLLSHNWLMTALRTSFSAASGLMSWLPTSLATQTLWILT